MTQKFCSFHPDLDEIEIRLKKRSCITFTFPDVKFEFRVVSAHEARNWDGTPSGWEKEDSRKAIEKVTVANGKTRYTNFWGRGQ